MIASVQKTQCATRVLAIYATVTGTFDLAGFQNEPIWLANIKLYSYITASGGYCFALLHCQERCVCVQDSMCLTHGQQPAWDTATPTIRFPQAGLSPNIQK